MMKTITFIVVLFVCTQFARAQQNLKESLSYLKNNLQRPDDYLVSKFQTYPYVLLGEEHAIKENLDFVASLIPKLYRAGVYNLCMEFGAYEKQQQLDSLLNAAVYDERLAKDMMYYYNVGWAYREYYDLYKTVWQFNRTLKKGEKKFRIVNLSYRYRWQYFKGGTRTPENMRAVFNMGTPDKFRTEIIQHEVIDKNEKALVYMGHVHVFTHYQIPILKMNNDDFCDYDTGAVGNRLFKTYPGKVFAITFHTPLFSKQRYNPSYVSPAGGELENILQMAGNPQVGFDLKNTPIGKLRDDSFFSLCHPDFKLEDYFDGYVFLRPFKQLSGCTVDDDFFTGKSWEEIKNNFPDPDWRSTASLEEYKKQIRAYADIPKRYADVIQTAIPTVKYGTINRVNNFPSKYVIPRNIDIWFPEGYDTKKKYAVLYMQDGQMLFDAAITWNGTEWQADENLHAISQEKNLKQCIVVGIWNTGATRHAEYFPQKPFEQLPDAIRQQLLGTALQGKIQSDNYLKFITQELKPYIDNHYATYTNRANTFIAGSSMGGLISMYALCEYPSIFGGAACLSTHWVGDTQHPGELIPESFMQYLDSHLSDPKTYKLYFDYGTVGLDSLYEPHQQKADNILKRKGYNATNHITRKFSGSNHSEDAWSKRLQIPLQFLLKK